MKLFGRNKLSRDNTILKEAKSLLSICENSGLHPINWEIAEDKFLELDVNMIRLKDGDYTLFGLPVTVVKDVILHCEEVKQ